MTSIAHKPQNVPKNKLAQAKRGFVTVKGKGNVPVVVRSQRPPQATTQAKSEYRKNPNAGNYVPSNKPRAPYTKDLKGGGKIGYRGNQAWHDQQNKGGFQMGDRDAGFQMGQPKTNPFVMGGNRSVSSRGSTHLRKERRRRKKSSLPFEV